MYESEDELSIAFGFGGVSVFEEVERGFFWLGFGDDVELSHLYEFDHVVGIDEGKDVWLIEIVEALLYFWDIVYVFHELLVESGTIFPGIKDIYGKFD